MAYRDLEVGRARDRERFARRTAEWRAAGLCARCGQRPPAPGRGVCEPCGEQRRVAGRARYAQGRGQFRFATRWRAVCEGAGPGRPRLHDLRRAHASHAVMSGENPPPVGKLLGHRRHGATAGYVHLADDHLVEAAERIGSLVDEATMSRRW